MAGPLLPQYRVNQRSRWNTLKAAVRTVKRFRQPIAVGAAGVAMDYTMSGAPGTSGTSGRAVETPINNSRNFNVTKTTMNKRKKRGSKKGKKKYRKFRAKVLKIVEANKGEKSITLTHSGSLGSVNANECRYGFICAYGNRGGSGAGYQDLHTIANIDGMTTQTSRFRVKSFWGQIIKQTQ